MNKPYFCRNFFVTDLRHKRLKNTIDLLLFYRKHFYGFSEGEKWKLKNKKTRPGISRQFLNVGIRFCQECLPIASHVASYQFSKQIWRIKARRSTSYFIQSAQAARGMESVFLNNFKCYIFWKDFKRDLVFNSFWRAFLK